MTKLFQSKDVSWVSITDTKPRVVNLNLLLIAGDHGAPSTFCH